MEDSTDMGYESCEPMQRRKSMSEEDQRQRRASIKAIMADPEMSPMTKRRSIQHLMDGRRSSISSHGASSVTSVTSSITGVDMGYGDVPMNPQLSIVCNGQTQRMEETRPPCSHYERNCTMVAPCCGAAFGCRICHDDCPTLPPPFFQRIQQRRSSLSSLPGNLTCMEVSHDDDGHHQIDRFAVSEVICRSCFTRQSSKT